MKNGLDEQYIDILKDILENGVTKNTRNGEVLSVFGRTIRYKFKDGKFPLLTTKKMYFKGIITELLWFLKGDTNIKYLVDNNCHIWDGDCYQSYIKRYNKGEYIGKTKLLENSKKNRTLTEPFTQEEFINKIKTDDEFAKKWGSLGKIYGYQWRNWNDSIDQISELIRLLKESPDSRRMVVNAWNISDLTEQVLPPCHYSFQVYTRELSLDERKSIFETRGLICDVWPFNGDWHGEYDGFGIPRRAISLMWHQRSVDVPLGLPFNIASYGLLLEIIAKEVNMVPDRLIGNLGDCHIYQNQVDGCKEQLSRDPFELPTLNIKLHFNNEPSFAPEHWLVSDFEIANYRSHSSIKFPLSN
jgi:thymidylate synthase